jgi:flagella basal body P-ring formation protein FlgA
MMRWVFALLIMPGPAWADSLVATHTIRAQSVIGPDDLIAVEADIPGALTDPAELIGLEAKVTIYAGRPILAKDIGAATVIERNQTVSLVYRSAGLSILTEGRALSRGGAGDVIKVMNLSSRMTVTGTIGADGTVYVTTSGEG